MLSVIEAHYYVRVRTAGRSRLLPYEDFTTTFRGGLAPRRETVAVEYHHGGIGPACPLPRDRRAGPPRFHYLPTRQRDPLGEGFACTWSYICV